MIAIVQGASAADAAAIIAVAVAVEAIIAALLFGLFRARFISERSELQTIRDTSDRLEYLTGSLSMALTASIALTEFHSGVLQRLLDHVNSGMDEEAFGEQIKLLCKDIARSNSELLLMTGDLTVAGSAARHLSNSTGNVHSLHLMHWVMHRCEDTQQRALLAKEIKQLEGRLDG
jgi:hypothetical protein